MNRRYVFAVCGQFILLGACAHPPALRPMARQAVPVSASFGKTWDAVVDVFGERDLMIHTIDRASGLIVPSEVLYADDSALEYADCGKAMGGAIRPSVAHFNVVVRGDSAASTVLVRAFFDHSKSARLSGEVAREAGTCVSTGVFETSFQQDVKERAELGPARAHQRAQCRAKDDVRREVKRTGDVVLVASHSITPEGDCKAAECRYNGRDALMSKDRALERCRAETLKPRE